MLDAGSVREVTNHCVSFLRGLSDRDWTVPVPGLELSVIEVVAHVAQVCLWYSIDFAAHGVDLPTVDQRVKTDVTPTDMIDTLETFASILTSVIAMEDPATRGFHPFGSADREGFAAMACDELLIHTDDAARGLGEVFAPPLALVAEVTGRLFPWVEVHTQGAPPDPWSQLRWANGRIALDGKPQLSKWSWHCAPLTEWDGTVPQPPGGH